MRVMGNLEYAYVINELQHLVGKHFSRFRQLNEDTFLLSIGDTVLLLQLGVRFHATRYMQQSEGERGFVTIVKTSLKNQKLKRLCLHNQDRIVVFEFDSELLVFEMFGKGNVILIEDGITVAAYREESWSDRKIKRKESYSFPKSNLKHDLREALSERFIISALLSLPLGKEYAKEVLARCKIPEKKSGKELTTAELDRLEVEINKVKSSFKPVVFYENGKIIDYGLTEFARYGGGEKREFALFNEALDFFYWNAEEKESEHVTKLKSRIEMQKKTLDELKAGDVAAKQCGDFIYANYEKIDSILTEMKKAKLEELEERFKVYNAKVNKKEKEVELEISD